MPDTKQRSYAWSITAFDLAAAKEQMALANQKGWVVRGQEETCPTTGRKHYQVMVNTPQLRMSAVIKHFKGAHVEPARNEKALAQYVAKTETRSGALPDFSKFPTLDQFWNLTYDLLVGDTELTDRDPPEIEKIKEYKSIVTRSMVSIQEQLENHAAEEDDPDLQPSDRTPAPAIWAVSRCLIRRGFCVEMMVANPQLKEVWKNAFWSIMLRTHQVRMTARQTDTAVIPTVEDTNAPRPPSSYPVLEAVEEALFRPEADLPETPPRPA